MTISAGNEALACASPTGTLTLPERRCTFDCVCDSDDEELVGEGVALPVVGVFDPADTAPVDEL